jgi:hypothetical protein
MSRIDAFVTAAIIAWFVGVYWIGDALREVAGALDRQAMATYCTSPIYAGRISREDWASTCGVPMSKLSARLLVQ